jgi:redox-sensitive bicupin YhaK (pirin superfamily)
MTREAGEGAVVSTVDADLEIRQEPVTDSGVELTGSRDAEVGGITVRRLLPLRLRRSVGAWCFIDHYGPMSVDGVAGMQVPPHPHIGLQTVTWLLAGEVLHRDSLGSEQMIRPGQLNLMTAGRGIAHAEESPAGHDPALHGLQLWVALPQGSRLAEPAFAHHPQLPQAGLNGLVITVLIGSMLGVSSPARTFSDLVGAQIAATRDASGTIPLNPAHEQVIFVAAGSANADGTQLRPGQLLYLGTGREQVQLAASAGSQVFLLGGVPLGESLLMWWNFVARTPQEISIAATRWRQGRFGTVGGYAGDPLPAPPLDAARLRPRP